MDYTALEKSLHRGVVSPVYLFYGEETFLRDYYLERFQELIPGEFRDFNLDVVDGRDTGIEEIINLAATLPFLSEKRVVIVKNADFFRPRRKGTGEQEETDNSPAKNIFFEVKPKKKGSTKSSDNALERYLDLPLDSTCLIFCTDGVDRNLRVYKKTAKIGQTVEFAPLKNRELHGWIERRARKLGKTIEPDAVIKLAAAVGSNLRRINSELEKLACFQEGSVILDGDVTLLVGRTAELSIFDLVDVIGERKADQAINLAREMMADGEPVLRLLFMIARQFRLLLRAKSCREKGIPDREAAGEMQVHPYVAQKCMKQSRNFSFDELKLAMEKLLETDADIKTGRQEPVLALELLIVSLCTNLGRG